MTQYDYIRGVTFTGTIGGITILCQIDTNFQSAYKVAQIRTKDSAYASNDYGVRLGTVEISGVTSSVADYYSIWDFHQNREKQYIIIEGPNFGDPSIQGNVVINTMTQVARVDNVISYTASLMFDGDFTLKAKSVSFTQTINLNFEDGSNYTGTKFIDTNPV